MRHNKFVGWEAFLGLVEQVEKYSPWLSRQIAKHASEWPFWLSGLQVKEWEDRFVRVHLPFSLRTSIDNELSHAHLLLGAELTLRLLLVRYRQEFPFRYRLVNSRVEVPVALREAIDYKFALKLEEWETLRLDLAREGFAQTEFVVQAFRADGRMAATFGFEVAFQLEKFLPT